jgi:hypothetical protein
MGCGCKEKAKQKADENAALRAELGRLNRLLALERQKNLQLRTEIQSLKA